MFCLGWNAPATFPNLADTNLRSLEDTPPPCPPGYRRRTWMLIGWPHCSSVLGRFEMCQCYRTLQRIRTHRKNWSQVHLWETGISVVLLSTCSCIVIAKVYMWGVSRTATNRTTRKQCREAKSIVTVTNDRIGYISGLPPFQGRTRNRRIKACTRS